MDAYVYLREATEKEKCGAFLYIIGRDIYSTFFVEVSEVDKIKPLIKNLKNTAFPKENTTMQRYKFNKRLTSVEELIRDRIICGVNSETLQVRLPREDDLTLEKAINICKPDKESRKEVKDFER